MEEEEEKRSHLFPSNRLRWESSVLPLHLTSWEIHPMARFFISNSRFVCRCFDQIESETKKRRRLPLVRVLDPLELHHEFSFQTSLSIWNLFPLYGFGFRPQSLLLCFFRLIHKRRGRRRKEKWYVFLLWCLSSNWVWKLCFLCHFLVISSDFDDISFFSEELMLFRDLFVDVSCILSTTWIMIWDCLLLKRLSQSMWLLICLGLCSLPSLIMWLSPVKLFRCSSTKICPLFLSAWLSTIFKRCCFKIFYVWDIRWLGSFLFIHFSVFFHAVLFLFFVNMICSS